MPLNEFWHGDLRLFEAYQIAYIRDKSYTAWLNGVRIFEANSKISHNENRAKPSDKVLQYDDWKDPIESKYKYTMTADEVEQEFRNTQAAQNGWLNNLLNSK
jgi:hypothetical protein